MTTSRLLKTTLLAALVLLPALTAGAAVPAGYYRAANGRSDAELKTALCNIIYNHTQVSSYNDLPKYFQRTDVYPGSSRWWDMYSDIPLYAPSFKGLNREHSFPKSWWGGLTDVPAYVDLNHLYPSEAAANMAKSNYPLGEVSTALFNEFVKVGYPVGGQGGGSSQVFEPNDEYKGDFARTYFYMVTCYQNMVWNTKYMYMVQQNTYPTLAPWAQQLLLRWNREDPVSQKEIDRNEEVYRIQNNRNPFIDYPELAEFIWGSRKGEPFNEESASTPVGDPVLITPVQDMTLEFNEVVVGNTVTSRLFFHGENLTKTLSVAVTGTDKAMFVPGTKSIPTQDVNTDQGYWLTVSYTPTGVGEHKARLIVSDGGLQGSLGVGLLGQGAAVPTLTAPVALEATDVTATSYTARWEEPAGAVDYYTVTRTRYPAGAAPVTEELLAEQNSLPIDGCTPGVQESYNVRSVRLGYRSAPSQEIYVSPGAGIDAIAGDQACIKAWSARGGFILQCTSPARDITVSDLQGRRLQHIDLLESEQFIAAAPGVYIVSAPGMTPVKAVAH